MTSLSSALRSPSRAGAAQLQRARNVHYRLDAVQVVVVEGRAILATMQGKDSEASVLRVERSPNRFLDAERAQEFVQHGGFPPKSGEKRRLVAWAVPLGRAIMARSAGSIAAKSRS